ncbi:MAG: hypothetical protein WB579_08585, partial [Bryobacteraceae bacterium]
MLTRRRFFTTGAAVPFLAGSAPEAAPASGMEPDSGDKSSSLNGLWLFRLDPDGKGEQKGWPLPEGPAAGWREVRV